MIKTKKILIKTTDSGIKTIQVRWEDDDAIKLYHVFGRDLERESISMIFHEIVNNLMNENVKLSELKSIEFKDTKEK